MKKEVVSFDLAKRLKKANYEQPTPADSQMWYDESGHFLLLIREIDGTLYACDPDTKAIDAMFGAGEVTGKDAYFAPTAQRLQNETPGGRLTPVQNPFLHGGQLVLNADELAERWLNGKE
jgi:hypothetical protein